MNTVSIVGVGRVGGALALSLSRAEFRIESLVYRSVDVGELVVGLIVPKPQLIAFRELSALDSDIVIIASADPEIQAISEKLAEIVIRGTIVLHTSGSLSSEVLSVLANKGIEVGSIHPLVSISDPILGSKSFAGAYFCIEGSEMALKAARGIVESLDGFPFSIETQFKSLYHASAVTASGHLIALIDIAVEMLSKCGLEREEAKRVLLPLIKSTIANLECQSSENALTGTFARADTAAFRRHLSSFEGKVSKQARQVYLELGDRSLSIAKLGSDAIDRADEIRKTIAIAKIAAE